MADLTIQVKQEPIVQVKVGSLVTKIIYGGGVVEADFDFNDVAAGSKVIGSVPAGARIPLVALLINIAFDGNTGITIGDDAGQGRLLTTGEYASDAANYYITEPHVKYASGAELKIYFPAGAPTQGEGTAIIYYQ